jgi:hypothetical protein
LKESGERGFCNKKRMKEKEKKTKKLEEKYITF